MSTKAPVMMPAVAPVKVNLLQNRLSRIAGPNAAPNTPHALDTRFIMVPLPGFDAIKRAIIEITMTTTRPTQSICSSLALFFVNMGLYTSLANAEALDSSWLSAVDIEAARIADRRMPLTMGGNILRTI